jgi:hypothetical protein
MTKEILFNIVLVHVARTWDRIREEQPFEEMPLDNIESVDAIISIANTVLENAVLQSFLIPENRVGWDWDERTGEGCSDTFIESLAYAIIMVEYIDEKPKPKVRKWEVINDNVEINEDFLPNSEIEYSVEFDGIDKFRATLLRNNYTHLDDDKYDNVPRILYYSLDKAVEDYTDEEKTEILAYRGLKLEDGFCADDLFLMKEGITLTGIDVEIKASVTHRVTFDEGETAEDFLNRGVDIYLHGSGEDGCHNKEDLGGNYEINFK